MRPRRRSLQGEHIREMRERGVREKGGGLFLLCPVRGAWGVGIMAEKTKKEAKFRHGMLAFGLLAAVMFGCVVGLGTDPQIPMLIGCVISGFIALYLGFDWEEILDAMKKGIDDSMEACLILICIGVMVAVWILSGTVPTMIYYGLEVVTPQLFCRCASWRRS